MNHTAIVKMFDTQQDVTKHFPQRAEAVELLHEDDEQVALSLLHDDALIVALESELLRIVRPHLAQFFALA